MENRKNIRGASDTGKGRYSTKYLLSGLVICGDCGTKFRRYGRRLASKEYVATLVCMNHQKDSITFFDTTLPKIEIEVEAGRNIGTLIETAALNYRLHLMGQDAKKEYEQRLRNTILKEG